MAISKYKKVTVSLHVIFMDVLQCELFTDSINYYVHQIFKWESYLYISGHPNRFDVKCFINEIIHLGTSFVVIFLKWNKKK